jgi:hypothetical protein
MWANVDHRYICIFLNGFERQGKQTQQINNVSAAGNTQMITKVVLIKAGYLVHVHVTYLGCHYIENENDLFIL